MQTVPTHIVVSQMQTQLEKVIKPKIAYYIKCVIVTFRVEHSKIFNDGCPIYLKCFAE